MEVCVHCYVALLVLLANALGNSLMRCSGNVLTDLLT